MRTFIKNMIRIKFKPLNLIPVNTIVSRQLETLYLNIHIFIIIMYVVFMRDFYYKFTQKYSLKLFKNNLVSKCRD